MSRILFLTGYRGSGKSTIAPLVAKLTGCDWVDTDARIQTTAGRSIAAIFADSGEKEFRRLETAAINEVIRSATPNVRLVVSLGGGAITMPSNQALVKRHGFTVYLRATVDTLWQRINSDLISGSQRPSLTDQVGRKEVQSMLTARGEIYQTHSDFQLDVDELTPGAAAQRIFDWWIS